MRLQFKSKWAHRVKRVLKQALRRPAWVDPAAPPSAAQFPLTTDWDEAYSRVESYLRAHHFESRIQLARMTSEIVNAGRALAASYPKEEPVTLAMQAAHARIGEWMVQAVGEGDWADQRFRARGRLALLLTGLPTKRPECFLSLESPPPEVRNPLSSAHLQAGPELRLAGMPPAPLEFASGDDVMGKWTTFSRKTFVYASLSWVGIAGLAGLAWLFTR